MTAPRRAALTAVRDDSSPQPVETMSSTQLARRQRVLDAVLELILDGADEDMQMKEIADRSNVALGTIYRYFSSKDHVLAAALVEWTRRSRAEDRPPTHPRSARLPTNWLPSSAGRFAPINVTRRSRPC